MTGFWVGAGLLSALALGFLLLPLWRERKLSGRWSVTGVLAAVVVIPIAFVLYSNVRTWQPQQLEQRSEEVRLVAQLAEKMAREPDDVQGWRLLGRSYVALGEYGRARDALEEAWKRTPNPDSELKLSFAEAQVLADRATLAGAAGELVEDVLAEEPGNPKALWYGAQRALGVGDEAAARTRLTRLLALGPPEEISEIIRAQLAQLPTDSGGGARAGAAAAGSVGLGSGESSGSEGSEAAGDPEGATIRLRVRLGDAVPPGALSPEAALFIFARDPQGGPPVAVIRQPASAVPGEFVLSDANSMLPGRSLGDFGELHLVARISASGQPLEQSGDLYAESTYRPGEEGAVELVIDKVVP